MNAGSIIALAREMVGDTGANRLTDTIGISHLNTAQRKFVNGAWPLERRKGFTASQYQDEFAIPSECIVLDGVWLRKGIERELIYDDDESWRRHMSGYRANTGDPDRYMSYESKVVTDRQMAEDSSTTTMGSVVGSTDTTFYVADTTDFNAAGSFKVGSEEVRYPVKTATTFLGCIRGVGNTDAATHATGATVTMCDLEMWYKRAPAALTASTSTPEVPAHFHEYLLHYLLYLYHTSIGEEEEADRQLKLYAVLEAEASKPIKMKQIGQPARIKLRR